MSSHKTSTLFGNGFGAKPAPAPVTRALCIMLVAVSLMGALGERYLGFGLGNLNFRVDRVLELWRFVSYPFVESAPWQLLLSLLFLWLFGSWFEQKYGGRDFIRFFALSCVGAALFIIPLHWAVNFILPFHDLGLAEGPDTALNAVLVALVLTAPDANVLFGFVLPMKAKTMLLLVIGIEFIFGIQTGAATLSTTLAGMLMGYLLVRGSPRYLLSLFRRRRTSLYVVPPRDKTLN